MEPVYDYDWALLKLVPDVCRGDACTVGVVLHARQARFLGLRLRPVAERDCAPLDAALVRRYLGALEEVAAGGAEAGPIGLLPPSERFHWMTAPRSTVLQTSPVHTGRTADPASALEALYRTLVASPEGAIPPTSST